MNATANKETLFRNRNAHTVRDEHEAEMALIHSQALLGALEKTSPLYLNTKGK